MMKTKPFWIFGLFGIVLVISVTVTLFWPKTDKPIDNPWALVLAHATHTYHTNIKERSCKSAPCFIP